MSVLENTAIQNGSVTAQLVPENVRAHTLHCVLSLSGKITAPTAEVMLYQWMAQLSDYKGGYWHMYTLSNGGFYMAPSFPATFNIAVEGNGFGGTVSADASGIIAMLFTLSHLAAITKHEKYGDLYHLLLDFAETHAEAASIFRAID